MVEPLGLRFVDVSDPSGPVEVGYLEHPHGFSNVIVLRGLAYVGGLVFDPCGASLPATIQLCRRNFDQDQ